MMPSNGMGWDGLMARCEMQWIGME